MGNEIFLSVDHADVSLPTNGKRSRENARLRARAHGELASNSGVSRSDALEILASRVRHF